MSRGWATGRIPEPLVEAFRQAAIPGKPGECWEWTEAKAPEGYGRFSAHSWTCSVHRLAYTAFVGGIPAGQLVRHQCDNPPCWNPQHLLVGTHADNAADKRERDRDCLEDSHPGAKLDSGRAREIAIAYLAGEPPYLTAARFGVHRNTVKDIGRGRTWRAATAGLLVDIAGRATCVVRGACHPGAKLTDELAREIAIAYIAGELSQDIAARYGVTRTTVGSIARRQTWRVATEGLALEACNSRERQLAGLARGRAKRRSRA